MKGVFATLGLTTGIALSLFFKNKSFVRNYFTGLGVGYAAHYNMKDILKPK